MIQSIILDGLIVLIILMIAAIGYSRGGMRELCTAAGLLFGSRLADAWAPRWGGWLADRADISEGSATFILYVGILVLVTLVCGYGAALAFFSRPGPGGRLYGAALGLVNGVVLTSFVLDGVRRYLLNGDLPSVVAESHVARAMVDGFAWILLGIAAFIVVATAFGFLIRENEPEESLASYAPVRNAAPPAPRTSTERTPAPVRTAPAVVPDKLEPARADPPAPQETAALRVREVRHWEEPVEPNPRTAFGAGWSQTWPVASPGSEVRTPWENEEERRRLRQAPSTPPSASQPAPAPQPRPRSDADALRDWLAEERKNDPDSRS